ncbi:hypothetical protein KFV02_09260 [Desulfohalobiaceae bacterium Ax17]|uniref:hypothetical protein n=1 Tax=Desulfovulcanus ferrireducens TaxID=2831190 RepID=UPI00207B9920|nr:hypothetical protein [Desulfovulcanus ferrireducens]MBT8764118.1 hypothetical protein [Desulfovulcanus ferrireducens]
MRDISKKVKNLFLVKAEKDQKVPGDFDLVEMPIEGVVAYWLSVKKILESKKNGDFLEQEIKNTTEPYIRYLLELLNSSLEPEQIAKFAIIKKNTLLKDLQRKLILMAISILGMSTNENPQKVLVRIISKFPISPIYEKQVFEAAQTIVNNLDSEDLNKNKFFNVDHRLKIESLIINLITYNMLARRKDRQELSNYLPYIRSFYFAEGLTLIMDGFDYDFIKHRLNSQKKEILELTETKMDLSADLCVGIKSNIAYADLHTIAKSYLL